ncbi:4-aminobutyrate--2-oxoglutarate transaminase [Allopusillimonas ginsengisoli]|uniref:4-aminobutyrate--2-oxoglutarate transaminase n=1 Tax=Allopusillimonas ginsengisoli TaxID=453575 RepID=UPI00101FA23F|nr:4-aminobutyrate--2-oxoglutarate transaminase [Allopusillimonas ginsengisoli]TEA78464.1 4-aminobutyrate--2-oxoglutarate transaminase [Allopusillimonas ginsengisoli]
MARQTWQQRKSQAIPNGISIMCDFFAERAENALLWDQEGRRYIDFAAGIAVTNTGHRHPRVVAAVSRQLEKFTHTAFQVAPYSSYIDLAEKINQITPGAHPKKTAFFTTGAEAVENAIKIARCATGRSGVIAFSGAFHGRTFMGMALTGKVHPYKASFGPMPAEIYHVPFPSALHGVSTQDSLKAINNLFKADIDPQRVAAIIIEPVQGEGGFNVAPPELLQSLRAICDQHGILLIADEVQTGFARTGKMFAIEHAGVVPDLMTLAKSLAGGMPLSAVCGRADIMDAPPPGALGGTYAGNPLALAAAQAVLEIIETEGLAARALQLGNRLRDTLASLKEVTPEIAEIRGLGAMIAVEFQVPESGEPNPAFARKVQEKALEQGLILLTCGTHANVVRFLFPLTIEEDILTEGLHILSTAIRV